MAFYLRELKILLESIILQLIYLTVFVSEPFNGNFPERIQMKIIQISGLEMIITNSFLKKRNYHFYLQ